MGMVTIIYYADPTKPATETVQCANITEFLLSRFKTRDQLLDLRFFDREILGHELNQKGGDFLDISEGVVAVTHNSMIPRGPETWVYIAIAAVFAVATVLLMPKIPNILAGTDTGRDQQSGTNRLGDSTNEARVNQRIDDIFGTVTKHTPPLWQVPYRIGVNNQETEVLLVCIGRGKYQIDANQWYDGDTPVVSIPNAQVSIYGPGTHPGSGIPELQIGAEITEQIGVYRQSNDLNPAELPPPNDLDTGELLWRATGSGSSAILTAVYLPAGTSLTDLFGIGDEITLNDCFYLALDSSVKLYLNEDRTSGVNFITYLDPVDLSENNTLKYLVTNVTSGQLTLEIPVDATVDVVNAWANMTDYDFPLRVITVVSTLDPLLGGFGQVWVIDENVLSNSWLDNVYDPVELLASGPVNLFPNRYIPNPGKSYNNFIGPFRLNPGVTEVILNFVSANGFYKLVENTERLVSTPIEIVFIETDINGVETGDNLSVPVNYFSNTENLRKSVFKTVRMDVPFDYSSIAVRRTGDRDKSENVSNVDSVEWRDLYTFEPVSVSDFGNVTLAHIIIPSNSQSRLIKQRKQNVTLTRLITEYLGNGDFGPAESHATDQFDQILIHTMLDPAIGRLSLEHINADGFLALRDEIIDYFGSDEMCRFGYDFDTTSLTAQDTFMMICDVMMCVPYHQAGVYDAFFEKRQEISSMQITCRNKLPGSETRKTDYDRKNDGVEITFRNNETGVSDTVYIPQNQSSLNPERIDLKGCTSRLQAYRYGARIYNKQIHQTEFIKFDVDEFGRNVVPGKRIDSPDSARFTRRLDITDGYRVYDGEVVEVNGLEVELSEPVTFTEGEDHYIVFTKENGENTETILCTRIDDYTVLLGALPSEPIYDGYGKDRTKFTFMSEQLRESVSLLPQTIEFSLGDDGQEINTINSTNYSHRFYDNDLDVPT